MTQVVKWLKDELEEYGNPQFLEISWEELDMILEELDKRIRENYAPPIG